MKAQMLEESGQKTFAVIFDTGDEASEGLLEFAKEHRVTAAHFTAIGGFSSVTLGYFDWEKKEYLPIEVNEQVEVLSLIGDVAVDKGEPKIHAHVVVGKRDGTTMGGHLMKAKVRPTLEVMLEEAPARLQRQMDANAGIPLIRLD